MVARRGRGTGAAAFLLAFLSAVVLLGGLVPVLAAAYYEIESQSREQSVLETAHFAPEAYVNTDHAAVLGLEHVVKPYNAGRDMQINLSDKSFTVECWLKHDRGTDHSLPGYFLSQGETANVGPGGRLLMGFKPDNTFELSFYDGVSLVTPQSWTGDRGQWHHWAVTYDYDTEARVVYRDGVEVGRDTTTDRVVAATGLRLGYAHLTDINRDIFFTGAIDEFRVWETVLEVETLRMYASLTSAWITDYHPNLAYLIAYLDFNEGTGLSSEDSGPLGFNAELLCGSDGSPCGSGHSWWTEGVGSNSLSMSRRQKVHRICPTPTVAALDANNTDWTYPDNERNGIIKPLPACNTDLAHRHEVLCNMEFAFHLAYVKPAVPGLPRHFLCDGAKWMPVMNDNHVWNNFMMPGYY